MHCKNCRAYFVRFPCPECGQQEVSPPIQPSKRELLAITIQEESLQKPSELKGGSASNPISSILEDPSLLKPSELNPEKLIDPNDPYNEKDKSEALIKPSELKGRSSVNLTSERSRVTSKVVVTSANLNLKPINESLNERKHITRNISRPKQLDGESDVEYKKRVRNTLLEVMTLLEKLIDEE